MTQWLLRMGEGRGASEETDTFNNDLFPLRPIKSNSYIEWDRKELSAVYLIDDLNTIKLKNKGCVLLGDIGEELRVLLKLFCGRDYDYHHLYDLQKNFNSWEQLVDENQMLPCTDIIINDRYLFNDDFMLVEYNLYRMLKAIVNNVKNKVNVVVYTQNDSIRNFGIDKATSIIKSAIEKTTSMKPNITYVTSGAKPTKIPHDRFVITNYRLIRSGDSFIYFNTKGEKITKGGSLDIDSLAKYETYVFVNSLLESLQSIYNEINIAQFFQAMAYRAFEVFKTASVDRTRGKDHLLGDIQFLINLMHSFRVALFKL
jgi:hypothetical protein